MTLQVKRLLLGGDGGWSIATREWEEERVWGQK
jgi:hypothetical protein